jgi:triosephosphate isomerase (TIM)
VRRTFIAGNWKMQLNRTRAVALAQGLARNVDPASTIDVAVCPPFVYLDAVHAALEGSPVALGAQNMYFEPQGAFTGEISGDMLVDVACRYVILGHSERRHRLGETNQDVNRKIKAALGAGLTPIVCVGETLQDREAGRTSDVVCQQFDGSFAGLTSQQMGNVVIAYEPVWAIVTGKVATPEQAEQVHADLRNLLENRYNKQTAHQICIQYGGSVKPENASDLLGQPNIDGALVGGASLEIDSFLGILRGAP